MALSVYLYGYRKRKNSTAHPVLDTGVLFECSLKEASSILSPTLVFSFQGNVSPAAYNYAAIPQYARYYWIVDWTYDAGRWFATCAVDVLASWRSEIGESTQYVLRSSYEYDGTISDIQYPMTTETSVKTAAIPTWTEGIPLNITDGIYVVGITNSDVDSTGAASYYAMTQSSFNDFKNILMSNTTWMGDVTDISNELLKSLFNPLQYLVSCKWFPTSFDSLPSTDSMSTLSFGWWSIPVTQCKRIPSRPAAVRQLNISFGDTLAHPQSHRGSYLNCAPYTKYLLDVPSYGRLEIPSILGNYTTFLMVETMDFATGEGILQLFSTDSPSTTAAIPFLTYSCVVGIDVTLAQSTSDVAGAATSLIGSFNITKPFTSLAKGAIASMEAVSPVVSQINTTGSFASLVQFSNTGGCTIYAIHYHVTAEDNADLGRPLCQARQISTIPGFIIVEHADLSTAAHSSEMDEIKSFMENGFFYE